MTRLPDSKQVLAILNEIVARLDCTGYYFTRRSGRHTHFLDFYVSQGNPDLERIPVIWVAIEDGAHFNVSDLFETPLAEPNSMDAVVEFVQKELDTFDDKRADIYDITPFEI